MNESRPTVIEDQIRRLQREVTCTICSSELQDPRLLPCLHYYCKDCIEGIRLQFSTNRYVCPAPQCHDEHAIPNLEILPRHCPIVTKKQHIRLLRKIGANETYCEICSSEQTVQVRKAMGKLAVYVCMSCNEGHQLICETCSRAHVSCPELRDHKLDPLSVWQVPRNREKMLRKMSTQLLPAVCRQHGYQLRYNCEDCDSINCCDCLRSHQGHTIRQIENAAEQAKRIVMQRLVVVAAGHEEFQAAAKDIMEVRERLRNQEGQREMDIKTRFARIKLELDSRQKAMIQDLHSIAEWKQNRLAIQLHQLEGVAKRATRLEELMDELVNAPSITQLLTHVDFLLLKSNEFENTSESVRKTAPLSKMLQSSSIPSLTPCESSTLAVNVPNAVFQAVLRDQCKVYSNKADAVKTTAMGPGLRNPRALEMTYFNVNIRDSSGQPYNQNYGLRVHCYSHNKQIEEYVRLSSVSQGTVHVSYTPRTSTEYTVTVKISEENISGSPFTVPVQPALLLSANLEPKLLSSLKQLDEPVHICINETIYVVSQNGTIRAFDRAGNEETNFEDGPTIIPGGMAIAEDKSLFITSCEHGCLSKYSPNGVLVTTQGKPGCKPNEYNNPGGISIKTATREVFVCDKNNHRVQVLDENLEYLREFSVDLTTEGFTNLSEPTDILISSHGSLYIIDQANNSVLVYSSDEKYQFSWGSPDTSLESPKCIVADSDGLIYVTDSQGVKAFQADGDHIASFQDNKHLKTPIGLAVDNDGHVYVCDIGNNTVMAFKDTPVKVI